MPDEVATPTFSHHPIQVRWIGDLQFEAGRDAQAPVHIDGDARSAPGPFDMLLAAIATCASVDVVTILGKQRTPPQSLEVRVEATRVSSTPRRISSAVLHFAIRAQGAARAQVERAVELSVTKYCSVRSSLAGDVPVTWTIELES
jgi:putative redox protein